MKMRAAICVEPGGPLEVDAVDLEGPRAGECLVRLVATGVCHTDAYTMSGRDPSGLFPAVLGHEGGGIVEEVGPGVRGLAVGDHVIPLYIPECRRRRCRAMHDRSRGGTDGHGSLRPRPPRR